MPSDHESVAAMCAARFRFTVKSGRAVNDPEKLVTPGVLYVRKTSHDWTAHLLAFGWWDYHISFLLAVRAHIKEQHHAE